MHTIVNLGSAVKTSSTCTSRYGDIENIWRYIDMYTYTQQGPASKTTIKIKTEKNDID